MTSINSMSNVSFQGKIKKTPRGHEYQLTNKSRNIGAGVGLLSGALVSHMAAKKIKTAPSKKPMNCTTMSLFIMKESS